MKKYETPVINITEIKNAEVIMASTLAANKGTKQDTLGSLDISF